MATPTADTYSVASGETLYAGRTAELPVTASNIGMTVIALPSSVSAGAFALLATGNRSLDWYGCLVEHQTSVYMPSVDSICYFGAETHGDPNYYVNSPYRFSLSNAVLYKDRASDLVSTYRFDNAGICFSDSSHERPWAMHTVGQMARVGDELVVAYPATQHSYYADALPPIREGAASSERYALWYYRPSTGLWRIDDGSSNNAAVAGFFSDSVGYGFCYSSSRNSIMGVMNGYWRELNLSTYTREAASPAIPGINYNSQAILLDSGVVLVGFGSSANTVAYAMIDPADPSSYSTVTKASIAAMSGYSIVNTAPVKLHSGKVVLFAKDQSLNRLVALLYDADADTWSDTGHALSISSAAVADGWYWFKASCDTSRGVVILSSNVGDQLNVWGYKPSVGV